MGPIQFSFGSPSSSTILPVILLDGLDCTNEMLHILLDGITMMLNGLKNGGLGVVLANDLDNVFIIHGQVIKVCRGFLQGAL